MEATKKQSVIYSPFVDYLLLAEFKKKAISIDPRAVLEFHPRTQWHDVINTFDFVTVPQTTEIFKSDSTIGDYRDALMIQAFKEKNKFTINTPMPKPPENPAILECLALAVMELITEWPSRHKSEKKKYDIRAVDSHSGEPLAISGFKLIHPEMAVIDKKAVSAKIHLKDDFIICLSDTTAFAPTVKEFEEQVKNPSDLYSLVAGKGVHFHSRHYHEGYVVCPRVNETYTITDHLKDIAYTASHPNGKDLKEWLERIEITQSGMLSKLELTEWGVKARSEGYAFGRMILGASSGDHKPYYPLEITHGLVVSIWHYEDCVFLAYIPQENFEKVTV